MAVISISYNEGNKKNLGYKSVSITDKLKRKVFKSGNFVQDWYDAIMFYSIKLPDDTLLSHSSSVNHFIMDGAKFDSAYLHIENAMPVLKYIDESDPNYIFTQRNIYEGGIEFFVPKGERPTWEELKEMYGRKTKKKPVKKVSKKAVKKKVAKKVKKKTK